MVTSDLFIIYIFTYVHPTLFLVKILSTYCKITHYDKEIKIVVL